MESSDLRMHVSVAAALGHIHRFIEPRAVLLDNSGREGNTFLQAMREKSEDLSIPLIELPYNAAKDLMWIARLDSGSLRGKLLRSSQKH